MGYLASSVTSIPSAGFDWYVIFVEGAFADEIGEEISRHFAAMAEEAGRDTLVVRGFNARAFRKELFEANQLLAGDWVDPDAYPAILVMDLSPALAFQDADKLADVRMMLFPLEELYQTSGTIVPFLKRLLEALNDQPANDALQRLEPAGFAKGWQWLRKYAEIKVGWKGFSFDLGKAIDDCVSD